MKVLTIAFMFALVLCRTSAAEISQPHVKVSGTAVLEIKPDLLRWQLTVRNVASDASTVAQEHAMHVEAVLRFLRETGVAGEDVQSAWMQLGENRVHRDGSWLREGYYASTAVSFTGKDVARYRELWLGLAKLKAVQVDWVGWDSSKRIETQNEARLKALQAAKAKAQTMAAALGASVAEPLSIEEDMDVADRRGGLVQMNTLVAGGDSDGAGDDAIAAGTIPVRIRVHVAFRLIPGGP